MTPDSARYHNNYCYLLLKSKRYSEAEREIIEAIKLDLTNPEYSYSYSNLLLKLKRFNDAETQIKKALALDPEKSTLLITYSNVLMKIKNYQKAENIAKKAVSLDPNSICPLLNYASILSDLNRFSEAEEYYKRCLIIDNNSIEANYNFANLLKKLKKYPESEQYYKKVLEIAPTDIATLNNYAGLLLNLDRNDEAESLFKKSLLLKSDFAHGHNNYAYLLTKKGRLSEAEAHVRKALSKHPLNPYFLSTFGNILLDEEYFEEAIECFKKALDSPDSENVELLSEIHNNLGWIYTQQDLNNQFCFDLDKAKKEFIKAISYDETNVKAHRNLRAINRHLNIRISSNIVNPTRQASAAILLELMLIIPFIFFLRGLISEPFFVTMFLFLIAGIVIVLLYPEFKKVALGPKGVEFERSENLSLGSIRKDERDISYSR